MSCINSIRANIFLAELIRSKREALKISQRGLAKKTGLSNGTISSLGGARGFEKSPSLSVVIKVCEALEVSENEIWSGFFIRKKENH